MEIPLLALNNYEGKKVNNGGRSLCSDGANRYSGRFLPLGVDNGDGSLYLEGFLPLARIMDTAHYPPAASERRAHYPG